MSVMHRFIKWMFLAIGVLVLMLAIAGVIFEQVAKWPYKVAVAG